MKRFSLDEYLKNPSKKVVTRLGRTARIICTDANMKYPIVALIKEYGADRVKTYDTNGNVSSVPIDIHYSAYDLFFDEE